MTWFDTDMMKEVKNLAQKEALFLRLFCSCQARDGAISRGLPSSSTSVSVAVDRE